MMGRYGVVPMTSYDQKQLAKREPKKPWLSWKGWAMGLFQPYLFYRVFRAYVKGARSKEDTGKVARADMHDGIRDFADFRRVAFLQLLGYLVPAVMWGATASALMSIVFFAGVVLLWPSPKTRAKLEAAKKQKMLTGETDGNA